MSPSRPELGMGPGAMKGGMLVCRQVVTRTATLPAIHRCGLQRWVVGIER